MKLPFIPPNPPNPSTHGSGITAQTINHLYILRKHEKHLFLILYLLTTYYYERPCTTPKKKFIYQQLEIFAGQHPFIRSHQRE